MAILLKLTYNPNPINLYKRIIETVRDKMKWEGNYVHITEKDNYGEVDLIDDIKKLYNSFQ